MANSRSGYWDVEACRWVGAEATYVLPPTDASAQSQLPGPRAEPDRAGTSLPEAATSV